MKLFDLEAAKKGAAVCTRDGRKVRILSYDANYGAYNILAMVQREDGTYERPDFFFDDGHLEGCEYPTNKDLFMVPTKREGWVCIDVAGDNPLCNFKVFDKKEDAMKLSNNGIVVAHIEWEEEP